MRGFLILVVIGMISLMTVINGWCVDWGSNSNGSYRNNSGTFHIDSSGFNKKPPQNIEPLIGRAREIIDRSEFDKGKCPELVEIATKLQTFWLNANYEDRARINDVRVATEKKCGRI